MVQKYIVSVKPIDKSPFSNDTTINPKTGHYDKLTVSHFDIRTYFKHGLGYDSNDINELVNIIDKQLLNVSKYKFKLHENNVYVITQNMRMAHKFELKLESIKVLRRALIKKVEFFKERKINELLLKTLFLNYESLSMPELMKRITIMDKAIEEKA